ncbi:RagB/SusD family nutrient uptake outer membrane protein [Christiangramia forsetii]|uniref:SusD/RagB family protein n=2 Tax=Christiangramia forsetii TaxID=411153 RepID=A0M160_CHRFK|nr:RagB/SusD family nutrient uptake outer membrane protein [Christiangramia forsetii]GGG46330.1 membrane protein [Christiangramia forsetii]CAL66355.1 SusD/RagB family protein [Christiangramia forsetii KT0803]
MKSYKIITKIILALAIGFNISCEELVSIDEPTDKLVRSQVFNSEQTIISAMTGIYNELYQSSFSNGSRNSITVLSGLSSDNIRNINTSNLERMEFEEHQINPENSYNLELWTSAYNMIYMTNSFLEGLESAENIDGELLLQLEGEARFVRAFTYFNLVNLFGSVPLILTTDYEENALTEKSNIETVYQQVIEDLELSAEILQSSYRTGERTTVNKSAAKALLARVYLYLEDWQTAERFSTEVINESSTYKILDSLNTVFLANSDEAIWQISPIGGGGIATNTNDGSIFVIDPFFSFFASIQLRDDFVQTFQQGDKRLEDWIGFNQSKNAYFAHKYKITASSEFPIVEYSMVLRLAEQYLIRAEARTKQGNLSEALNDLNIIRSRANLEDFQMLQPSITEEGLLNEIFLQRRKELFTEWGHRWLDLKRSERIQNIFGTSQNWEPTDIFYPIPSQELIKNPNLTQNDGY